jgi:4-hydroxy-L-threonine phosphate dehydrogenase PdxA
VRTSPVHGTAYEIAGQGIADEKSFRQAVYLACDIFKKRAEFQQLNKNPLAFKTRK